MSIRLLAIELYRVMKRVEELQKKLNDASLGQSQRDQVAMELRQAKIERDRIKAILDGAKEQ